MQKQQLHIRHQLQRRGYWVEFPVFRFSGNIPIRKTARRRNKVVGSLRLICRGLLCFLRDMLALLLRPSVLPLVAASFSSSAAVHSSEIRMTLQTAGATCGRWVRTLSSVFAVPFIPLAAVGELFTVRKRRFRGVRRDSCCWFLSTFLSPVRPLVLLRGVWAGEPLPVEPQR